MQTEKLLRYAFCIACALTLAGPAAAQDESDPYNNPAYNDASQNSGYEQPDEQPQQPQQPAAPPSVQPPAPVSSAPAAAQKPKKVRRSRKYLNQKPSIIKQKPLSEYVFEADDTNLLGSVCFDAAGNEKKCGPKTDAKKPVSDKKKASPKNKKSAKAQVKKSTEPFTIPQSEYFERPIVPDQNDYYFDDDGNPLIEVEEKPAPAKAAAKKSAKKAHAKKAAKKAAVKKAAPAKTQEPAANTQPQENEPGPSEGIPGDNTNPASGAEALD